MDRLLVFGTGNATVTECYNTCFSLTDGKEFLLVDAGGGNGILGILKHMKVPVERMHHAFLSHRHTDHMLGMVWVMKERLRFIATGNWRRIWNAWYA